MSRRQEPALRSSASDPQSSGPHIRLMARWVAHYGVTDRKILSEKCGITPQRVSQITQSPLFKAEVSRLQSNLEDSGINIREELSQLTPRCLENITQDLYERERSAIRTKVSFDILDRIGFAPRQDSGGSTRNTQINIFAPLPGEDPQIAKERIAALLPQEEVIDIKEVEE